MKREYIVPIDFIGDIPPGNEELVRCKDCKHGEPGVCGDGIDCDGVWHEGDWFCADGVAKDINVLNT